MPNSSTALAPQKASQKNSQPLISLPEAIPDTIGWWVEQYFRFEVTTSSSSRKVQRRDLDLFVAFMAEEERHDQRMSWSPRLSKSFQEFLRREDVGGRRRRSDRTINRIMAHLKTFSKWIHKLRPFPLGDPMDKIRLTSLSTGLEIERALTPAERRKMLDAADLLIEIGGRSQDRSRFRHAERPKRKGYRAYRNRAIIYTLIETGMRRSAAAGLDIHDIDFKRKTVTAIEKGEISHVYQISNEGLQAIRDYLDKERPQDEEKWGTSALFLSPFTNPHGTGRLAARVLNDVWNQVAKLGGVEGRTPHSARHAMGKYIMEKTGNVAAVQRQLGHKNPAYSMQYSRITAEELSDVINKR